MLKPEGTQFRILDHEADIGLESYGKDTAELFKNTAYALFSLITDLETVTTRISHHISISNCDEMLVVFLNELLYLWDTEKFIPRTCSVWMDGGKLEANITGETFDAGKHSIYKEVKAVTYHKFTIQQEGYHLKATVFLDI
jgi:SHS2 domain-containing protein